MFSKSKSIELGGITPEHGQDASSNQPRRKSHADIEKLKSTGESWAGRSRSYQTTVKTVPFGIRDSFEDVVQSKDIRNSNGAMVKEKSLITQETLDKIREVELEDILMNARNITDPDPTSNMSFCPRPAKVIEGSFTHTISVKEVDSKTGAFRHRTIELLRKPDEELGFSVRRGDGWEKQDGIYVSRVSLGSVFDKFELMRVGDEILKINRIDMKQMDVEDVVRIMRIPEKLSITVKILTPFSKKRTSKSTIANVVQKPAGSKKYDILESRNSNSSTYKIAHMKIGRSTESAKKSQEGARDGKTTEASSRDQAKKDESSKGVSSAAGRSPYRTGASQRQLSPIRETASEERVNRYGSALNVSSAGKTSVTWLDQRSFNSDPGR